MALGKVWTLVAAAAMGLSGCAVTPDANGNYEQTVCEGKDLVLRVLSANGTNENPFDDKLVSTRLIEEDAGQCAKSDNDRWDSWWDEGWEGDTSF